MKKNSYVMVIVTVLAGVCFSRTFAKTVTTIQDLYKKMSSELIEVRKEFPSAQPKIYPLLDQLDKLYNTSKNIHTKKQHYKKLFKTRDVELSSLKKEISFMKNELAATKNILESSSRKFEDEKASLCSMLKEKDDALSKGKKAITLTQNTAQKTPKNNTSVNNFDDNFDMETIEKLKENGVDIGQSLSLTSTSAPTSPR